jgi:hypothetical protein
MEQMSVPPGDLDNDGDLDLVLVSHFLGQRNIVLRNDERGNAWVQFRLTGRMSNRDAVGARIEVTADLRDGHGPVTQMREVIAGTGFFTDIPRIQTFGLGKASAIDNVVIRWPNGAVQALDEVAMGVRHDIIEPTDIMGDANGDGVVNTADLLIVFVAGD